MEKVSYIKNKIASFNTRCISLNQPNMRVFINNQQTIKEFQERGSVKEFMENFVNCETYDVKKPWFVLSYDTYAQSMNDEEVMEYIDERLERMDFVSFVMGGSHE